MKTNKRKYQLLGLVAALSLSMNLAKAVERTEGGFCEDLNLMKLTKVDWQNVYYDHAALLKGTVPSQVDYKDRALKLRMRVSSGGELGTGQDKENLPKPMKLSKAYYKKPPTRFTYSMINGRYYLVSMAKDTRRCSILGVSEDWRLTWMGPKMIGGKAYDMWNYIHKNPKTPADAQSYDLACDNRYGPKVGLTDRELVLYAFITQKEGDRIIEWNMYNPDVTVGGVAELSSKSKDDTVVLNRDRSVQIISPLIGLIIKSKSRGVIHTHLVPFGTTPADAFSKLNYWDNFIDKVTPLVVGGPTVPASSPQPNAADVAPEDGVCKVLESKKDDEDEE